MTGAVWSARGAGEGFEFEGNSLTRLCSSCNVLSLGISCTGFGGIMDEWGDMKIELVELFSDSVDDSDMHEDFWWELWSKGVEVEGEFLSGWDWQKIELVVFVAVWLLEGVIGGPV